MATGSVATRTDLAAIILAGGRSSRLGRNKATVLLGSQTLLERAIEAAAPASHIVVVAPEKVVDNRDPRIKRVLEDPPFGGPVAGIIAGVAALDGLNIDRVLLLSCDVPGAQQAVPRLLAATATNGEKINEDKTKVEDGVCARDSQGFAQYLLASYDATFLRERAAQVGDGRDMSVRAFFRGAQMVEIPMDDSATRDVDTEEDLNWVTNNIDTARSMQKEGD